MNPTQGIVGSTISMAANATAQTVALPTGGGLLCEVNNVGPQTAFVDFFTSNAPITDVPSSSVGGGRPVLGNVPKTFVIPEGSTHVSAVSSGNSTLYFTRCQAR